MRQFSMGAALNFGVAEIAFALSSVDPLAVVELFGRVSVGLKQCRAVTFQDFLSDTSGEGCALTHCNG
jgi:hypothetical protein